MSKRKLQGSWERTPDSTYSPAGLENLRRSVRSGLREMYTGIIQSMFEHDLSDQRFEIMNVMSRDLLPERLLMKYGMCVWFEEPSTKDLYCMPCVMKKGVNMYGFPASWSPIPYGWSEGTKYSPKIEQLMQLELDDTNSVIMLNNRKGEGDLGYIFAKIDELVNVQLTENQLVLLARAPFVFSVTEDNLLTAKNFFLKLARCEPVIYTNKLGEESIPEVLPTPTKMDPAVCELFDRFMCDLLEFAGIECVPITKRAQQSVSEVQSNNDKIYLRRLEKLTCRQKAYERINKMFGVNASVRSIIDDRAEEMQQKMMTVGNETTGGEKDE